MFSKRIILVYHGIGDVDRFLQVSEFDFLKQMIYLMKAGYEFLPVEQILVRQSGKYVTLVFDDGYSSLKKVYPFLSEYKIHFSISVIAQKILERTNGRNFFLTLSELQGFERCDILSHGYSHIDLTNVSIKLAQEEISKSKEIIERSFNRPVDIFVYPFGKINRSIIQEVKKSGYQAGLTLLPFHVTDTSNQMALPRININGCTSFARFKFLTSFFGNFYLHVAYKKRKLFGQSYLKP